ncbi:hypothetical protein [Veillonella sp. CNR 79/14]|jgi:hypothetical protein|uniref:hypothetical protein n=1 Tax=Veillonella sp. CNR 79/14 TaxID=2490954 RepID=UPI000F8F753F|nr:hypothetical protein [Veillonella sp. CNR 79/14]DAT29628.1 MAG TPA: hypothetical protein [Caudoviricetes sp.]
MENQYVFVLDEKGTRITSLLVGVHGETEEACIEIAKRDYPNHTYVTGGDEMQRQFIDYKCYVNGEFIDYVPEAVEPSKKDKIEVLKKEAEKEREQLKEAFLTKQMKGLPVDDIKDKFKQIDIDLIKKIRELK